MTKKQKTFYGILITVLLASGGVLGAAFTLGAGKQRVQDTLVEHTTAIEEIEESIDLGTERYIDIMKSVADLGADIRVLTEVVERIDKFRDSKHGG